MSCKHLLQRCYGGDDDTMMTAYWNKHDETHGHLEAHSGFGVMHAFTESDKAIVD